jgi:hypothetical protein
MNKIFPIYVKARLISHKHFWIVDVSVKNVKISNSTQKMFKKIFGNLPRKTKKVDQIDQKEGTILN